MKILFVSPTDLRSPKASSTAILLTVQALLDEGHEVTLLSRGDSAPMLKEPRRLHTRGLEARCIREPLIVGAFRETWPTLWFKCLLVISALQTQKLARSHDLIWTRSPLSLKWVRHRHLSAIIEVHAPLSSRETKAIERMGKKGRVLLVFNSNRQRRSAVALKSDDSIVARAAVPAIDAEEIRLPELFLDGYKGFQALYLGRFESMGVPKGADLIFEACLRSDFPSNFRITFIGGSEYEVQTLQEKSDVLGISKERLRFFRAVNSSTALEMARRVDLLLAVYNRETSDRLTSEGPRKLYDYAFAGRPVVASRSANVLEVYGCDEATYFEENDPKSLNEALKVALSDLKNAPRPRKHHVWAGADRNSYILSEFGLLLERKSKTRM